MLASAIVSLFNLALTIRHFYGFNKIMSFTKLLFFCLFESGLIEVFSTLGETSGAR